MWKVSISYRAARIIADLLPSKYLEPDATQAIIEFLGEVLKTKKQVDAEEAEAERE